jgi:uncharacterized membrane protein YdjX (TVP38/TMEM64 family)
MNYYISLLIEASVVGICLIIVGSIIAFLVRRWYPKPLLPKSCASYNKYYVMEFTLFLTGFLFHLICEASGVNKWYLTNSAAASYSS